MKRFIAILLLAFAGSAHPAERFANYKAYIAQAIGKPYTSLEVHAAEAFSPKGRVVFGIAHDAWRFSGDETGIVFIMRELKNDAVEEVARSKLFPLPNPNGKLYVNSVDAQSAKRFSITINFHGTCGDGMDTYRFALVGKDWLVTGLDSERYECDDGDEAMGDARTEKSSNFLTGRITEKTYRKNRLVKSQQSKKQFPKFPLSDFAVFDERHGRP